MSTTNTNTTPVPTHAVPKVLRLAAGGFVHLRRAKRQDVERIMAAAEVTATSMASQLRFARLLVQFAVTHVDQVIDPHSPDGLYISPLNGYSPEAIKGLGTLANAAVYEAMSDEEIAAVTAYAQSGTEIPEHLLGK